MQTTLENDRRTLRSAALLTLLCLSTALPISGQKGETAKKQTAAEKAAADKVMAKQAAAHRKAVGLGDQHRLLRGLAGALDAEFKLFMTPGKPMTAKGKASGNAILGGRFLRLSITMPMMGREMHHEVTLGFDKFQEHFDFTWLSDQSTASVRATGKGEKKGGDRLITLRGRMKDAMAGDRPVRHTFLFREDKSITFTTFDTLPNGKELKIMEIRFTAAKKPSPAK